ncbi:MAG: hypothetical protein CTY25_12070 [Methylobacterium sp.]|nr:MAG: hypothetical protein CTY25_12070 [Methylobacterium sp.]
MESDGDDVVRKLVEKGADVVKREGGSVKARAKLVEAISVAKKKGSDITDHPLWTYRYELVALALTLPSLRRQSVLIEHIKAMGIEIDDKLLGRKVFGGWLKKVSEIVLADIDITQEKTNDERAEK